MPAISLLALAAMTLAQQTDTTLSVSARVRLEVRAFSGEIRVDTWSRNAIRIRAEHNSRTRVEIEGSESSVQVRARTVRGEPASVDFVITAPASARLALSGVSTDVIVEGIAGEITAETTSGDVSVRGGSEFVSLKSVEGDIALTDAAGRVDVGSVNGDVQLAMIRGRIMAETVNGDVSLERIESDDVEAGTVSGDVTFSGSVSDRGRYRLTSHNGDLTITVPQRVNATVSVSTFNGEFESSFPVTLTEIRPGKRFTFTLGSGGARLELESFNGTIQLRRSDGAPRREER